MATRGRSKAECYVYRIFDGAVTVYVGKGSGRRLRQQERRFGLPGEILERFDCDDKAFKRERELIASLRPTENVSLGGSGGRSRPKPVLPTPKWVREMEKMGTRKYVARFLLARARYLLSPDDLTQILKVAQAVES